ncbi:MerR family DNA-binding transcriptional regulator [Zoogloea sp.]|uniref:MerR family transcriptional regulator n=1 Tax=Zoogloea sp. TaxID=49181 RepID=UPI0035B3697E
MTEEQNYTIGELAREFGITPRAIRFYEDEGLLTPTRAGRNRVYAKRDRVRLRLILRGKRLGLSLAEIGELLGMYDGVRNSVPQLRRLQVVLAERRRVMEQQREDIVAVLGEIEQFELQCVELLAAAAGEAPRGADRA